MATFRMHLTTTAETTIEFELPDLDEFNADNDVDLMLVESAFWETNPDTPTLCHQCAGGGRYGQNLSIGDEWEVAEITIEDEDD